MTWNDATLRSLYRQETGRPDPAGASCPSPEALAAGSQGELKGAEQRRIVEHLSICSDCADEMKLAFSIGEWAEMAAAETTGRAPAVASSSGRGRRRSAVPLLALAAGMLLAAGLSFFFRRSPGPEPYRQALVLEEDPARWAVEPEHLAVLDEAPELLRWEAAPEARRYQVELYDSISTPLWKSGWLHSPSARLPEEARRRLERGRRYYWRVTVERQIERRSLPLFQFELAQ